MNMVNKKIQEKAIKVEQGLNKHFKGSKELVDVFLAGVLSKANILLWASHGKGKSFLAETTAKLANTTYARLQGSSGLTESKALARYDVGKLLKGEEEVKWRDFIFARIKLLDEVNRTHPTLLNSFFTMLAEKMVVFGDKRVDVPPFTFIASLPPEEEILIMENSPEGADSIIKRVKIGKYIENLFKKNPDETIDTPEYTILKQEHRDWWDEDENIKEIKTFSFNPKTNKIEPLLITSFIRHEPTDYIFEIITNSGKKVKVTGSHSVFISDNKTIIAPIEVDKLKNGDKIALPNKIENNKLEICFNLCQYFERDEKDIFITNKKIRTIIEHNKPYLKTKYSPHRIAVFKNEHRLPIEEWDNLTDKELKTSLLQINGSKNKVKTIIDTDEDLCWLIGFFVAEGSTQKAKNNKETHRYNFWLSNKNKERLEKAQRIIKDKIGLDTRITLDKRNNVLNLTISSYLLFKIFRDVFKIPNGCKNKRIPSFIFQIKPKLIKSFLDGYVEGDGSYGNGLITMSTTSKNLANDLSYLFLVLGYNTSIYKHKEKRMNRSTTFQIYIKGVKNKKINELKIQKTPIIFDKIKTIKKIKTKPKYVYDLEVLNNKKLDNFIGGFGGVLLHNTMNPADSGTYELPAPFWDRFDICVLLPSIRFSDKLDIISGMQNGVKEVLSNEKEIEEIWKDVETVEVPRDVKVLLISLTRDLQLCIYGEKEFITNFPQCCEDCRFKEFICSKLDNRFPISERFYLSVVKVAKAYAYLNGREKITSDDVLVIAKYGLYHRAKFTPTFEQKLFSKQIATDKIVEQLIDKNIDRKDAWKLIKEITDGNVGKIRDLEKWWIDNDLLLKEIYEELKAKIDEKKAVVSSKLGGKTPEELQRILDSDVDPEIKREAMELLDKHLAVMTEIPYKKYPKFLARISNISQPIEKYLRGYYANGGGVPNGEISQYDNSKFQTFLLDSDINQPETIILTIKTKSIDTQRELEQLFKSINVVFKKIGA